jgi:hypothetical protein
VKYVEVLLRSFTALTSDISSIEMAMVVSLSAKIYFFSLLNTVDQTNIGKQRIENI